PQVSLPILLLYLRLLDSLMLLLLVHEEELLSYFYTLSLHDALPICNHQQITRLTQLINRLVALARLEERPAMVITKHDASAVIRSEEHTSELQSRFDLVCRLLLEKKNLNFHRYRHT